MSRTKLVAGNWKMHGSRAGNAALLDGVLAGVGARSTAEVVVCPPFVYLAETAARLAGSAVSLGAQDVCAEPGQGAYTGEVGAAMLREVGCSHVIVGHSERRALYGESDQLVARKALTALAAGLLPIVCVGELLEERDAGRTHEVVGRQLAALLDALAAASEGLAGLARCVIAYEPVWAIGTGRTASPEQAQDVHAFIRGRIAARDATIAGSMRVLYGGSVKPGNARELFSMSDVDGGLIGGASLKAEEFVAIVAAAGA
ncbi:MAG: triose-phosphate isomerase [Gammaproteobacteria bacterium]|nr:triose-phosphate isomerase [Gammaproteobacteria bacterium]